jgi:chemotaxis protein MotB
MAEGRSAADGQRRAWLPWALLGGVAVLALGGGLLASRSISALLERNAQLEAEALESEARVAELQVLRYSMERRLKVLEQQQTGTLAQREGEARKAGDLERQLLRRESARLALVDQLKPELDRGDAWLDTLGTEALRLEVSERLLFEPGQSGLTAQGVELLKRVGPVLASVEGHAVEVSSHTDELPAASGTGPAGTSWELSTARATTLVRSLLEAPTRMAPERLSATGHASFRPAVAGDSPQNRQRNRRVTLMLAPIRMLPEAVLAAAAAIPPPPAPVKAEPRAKPGKKSGRR